MRALTSSGDGGGGVAVAATASFLAAPCVPAALVAWAAETAGARASVQMRAADVSTTSFIDPPPGVLAADYRPLHLAVPVLRLRVGGAEHFEVPLAAPPGLDHLGGDHVDEDHGEAAPLGIAFEVVGGLVPAEARIQHHRQEEIVAVVDDDQLPAGTLHRRVIDEVLLGAVRADIALQREVARDDFLDRDFLVPAVAAVLLFAARLGDVFGVAERAADLRDGFTGHGSIVLLTGRPSRAAAWPGRTCCRRIPSPCGAR